MLVAAATSFHWIPSDHLITKIPFVDVSNNDLTVLSINWVLCDESEDLTNLKTCANSWLAQNSSKVQEFLDNIGEHLNCSEDGLDENQVTANDQFYFANLTKTEGNGTFCSIHTGYDIINGKLNSTRFISL